MYECKFTPVPSPVPTNCVSILIIIFPERHFRRAPFELNVVLISWEAPVSFFALLHTYDESSKMRFDFYIMNHSKRLEDEVRMNCTVENVIRSWLKKKKQKKSKLKIHRGKSNFSWFNRFLRELTFMSVQMKRWISKVEIMIIAWGMKKLSLPLARRSRQLIEEKINSYEVELNRSW